MAFATQPPVTSQTRPLDQFLAPQQEFQPWPARQFVEAAHGCQRPLPRRGPDVPRGFQPVIRIGQSLCNLLAEEFQVRGADRITGERADRADTLSGGGFQVIPCLFQWKKHPSMGHRRMVLTLDRTAIGVRAIGLRKRVPAAVAAHPDRSKLRRRRVPGMARAEILSSDDDAKLRLEHAPRATCSELTAIYALRFLAAHN